jgi:hypothetical protein
VPSAAQPGMLDWRQPQGGLGWGEGRWQVPSLLEVLLVQVSQRVGRA